MKKYNAEVLEKFNNAYAVEVRSLEDSYQKAQTEYSLAMMKFIFKHVSLSIHFDNYRELALREMSRSENPDTNWVQDTQIFERMISDRLNWLEENQRYLSASE